MRPARLLVPAAILGAATALTLSHTSAVGARPLARAVLAVHVDVPVTQAPPAQAPPTTVAPTTVAPATVAPPTTAAPATAPPATAPPATAPPATTPATTTYGCAAAVAYLATHAAPGFRVECPGPALGHQAMTCIRVAGVCPGEELISIAVPCWAAYANEANNSWVLTGQRAGRIDPYGHC